MLNKKEITDIFKIGFTLCAITAVSAFVLALVNDITAPVIAANVARKQTAAMQKVLPEATGFTETEQLDEKINTIVKSMYEANDENGNTIGYAVMVSPYGYGGEISLAVGVDNDLKVTGVDVISQTETAGLGNKCTEDEFKNQYIGKTLGIDVVKKDPKENEIDAISSATVTSKAVTSGVNAAIEAAQIMKGDK